MPQRWQRMSDKLRYIGLISPQSGGKDYVGSWLQKNIERKCKIVKFATKLTEVVAAALCVDDLSLFQDRAWKEKKIFQWQNKIVSARDVQISLGTDILRKLVDDDIWVTAFNKAYSDPSILYIATDVRFPNEMDFIQQNNGIVVYIDNREALTYQHRKENGVTHSSEKLMWSLHYGDIIPDYVLDNNNFDDLKPLQKLLDYINKRD